MEDYEKWSSAMIATRLIFDPPSALKGKNRKARVPGPRLPRPRFLGPSLLCCRDPIDLQASAENKSQLLLALFEEQRRAPGPYRNRGNSSLGQHRKLETKKKIMLTARVLGVESSSAGSR